MKNVFLATVLTMSFFLLQLPCSAEDVEETVQSFTLMQAATFFGYFLLVMAVIFGALLLTVLIGKWQQKHKK